jgi:hypothetical protein
MQEGHVRDLRNIQRGTILLTTLGTLLEKIGTKQVVI